MMMKDYQPVLSIYFQHWGREQARLRQDKYRTQCHDRTIEQIFSFWMFLLEVDDLDVIRHFPRLPNKISFLQASMRLNLASLVATAVRHTSPGTVPFVFLVDLSCRLFPLLCPPLCPRHDVPTPSEHRTRYLTRVSSLHQIALDRLVALSATEILQVHALVVLPPLSALHTVTVR